MRRVSYIPGSRIIWAHTTGLLMVCAKTPAGAMHGDTRTTRINKDVLCKGGRLLTASVITLVIMAHSLCVTSCD